MAVEDATHKSDKRTKEMRSYYKDEVRKFNEAKQERQEAFEFCKSR